MPMPNETWLTAAIRSRNYAPRGWSKILNFNLARRLTEWRTTAKRLPSGDTTVQTRIEGFVDFTHAARAQGLQHLAWAEFRTAIQTHDRIPSSPPLARLGRGQMIDCTADETQAGYKQI